MKYTSSSKAGTGKTNEDAILVIQPSLEEIVAMVCDGMGGLDFPEIASEIMATSVKVVFSAGIRDNVPEQIHSAFALATEELTKESARRGARLGCAVGIVVIKAKVMWYSSIGNVRIYLTESDITKRLLTQDDVYTDENGISYLTNCIKGNGSIPDIQVMKLTLPEHYIVETCSDGYYESNPIDDSSIVSILQTD